MADKDRNPGYQLILADVLIENFRIELDLFTVFGRLKLRQWVLADQQVPADVINVIKRIRQHDDAPALFRIEANERVVTACGAVVPNNFVVESFENVPVQ